LRDIRRQGKRLVESLEAVPDMVAANEVPELAKSTDEISALPPAAVKEEALQPFTYLWLRALSGSIVGVPRFWSRYADPAAPSWCGVGACSDPSISSIESAKHEGPGILEHYPIEQTMIQSAFCLVLQG
jgi:hypothetical protein